MSRVIRVDNEVYRLLAILAAELKQATGKYVTVNEAVAFSIGFYKVLP